MYEIFRTSSFKKDYKKLSNSDKEILKEIVTLLANGDTLDKSYRDHSRQEKPTNIYKIV